MTLKRFSPSARAARVALIVRDFLAQLGDLVLELADAHAHRIHVLAARRAVGNEAGAVVDRIDRHRLGRDADDGRAGRHILGDDRIGADLGALADLDRPEHLRARPDDHAVADRRVALAARRPWTGWSRPASRSDRW